MKSNGLIYLCSPKDVTQMANYGILTTLIPISVPHSLLKYKQAYTE